jgi:hypothetical protein
MWHIFKQKLVILLILHHFASQNVPYMSEPAREVLKA